ncbi:MAG: PspA/IM30 family protein [Clostridiales bacterium]|nr:PspA/IM30 family protein [Clostridiales bacterium]
MGIITRFKDIMSANINALLDKAEDPSKMIDQFLRNLESDLGRVKAETAAIMAEETRSKRMINEIEEEVEKLQKYAEKAVLAGNDEDAKRFLSQKKQASEKQINLKQAYDLAAANATKMRQMHDKLVGDISELNSRKDAIKAKLAVAKTQKRLNEIGSSIEGASDSLSAFDRMEAKADKMLDEANAMAELNSTSSAEDAIGDLKEKYDSVDSADVEDELASLKAQMGL